MSQHTICFHQSICSFCFLQCSDRRYFFYTSDIVFAYKTNREMHLLLLFLFKVPMWTFFYYRSVFYGAWSTQQSRSPWFPFSFIPNPLISDRGRNKRFACLLSIPFYLFICYFIRDPAWVTMKCCWYLRSFCFKSFSISAITFVFV